jgi:hypothetical protein
MAILAKDIEWQAYFEELAKQVDSFSNAKYLDTESNTEIKTHIASWLYIALLV